MATPTARFADPFVTATLIQYGTTMLAVQHWEQAVTSLVGAATFRSAGGDGESFERALRVGAKKSRKLIRRGTASAMHKVLDKFRDDDILTKALIAELSRLNETRSYLIHSYLTDHIGADTAKSPPPAVVAELVGMHKELMAATEEMARATNALLKRSETSQRPKQMRAAMAQLSNERHLGPPAPLARPAVGDASPEAASIKLWGRSA